MTCVIVQFCNIRVLDSQLYIEDSDEEKSGYESAKSLKRSGQDDPSSGGSDSEPSQKRTKTE